MCQHCPARWLILSGRGPKFWDPKIISVGLVHVHGSNCFPWGENNHVFFFLRVVWNFWNFSLAAQPSASCHWVPKRQHLHVSSQRGAAGVAGHVCQDPGSTSKGFSWEARSHNKGQTFCCTKYLDYSYFGISDEGYLTIPRICMHLLGVIFWQWHRARSPFCKSATTQAPGRNKCCVNREAPCVITWSGQIRPLEEIPCTDPSSEKIWEDSYSRWLSWSEWCQIVPISTCPQNNNW